MKTNKHHYTLDQAIQGYLLASKARGLSDHTIKDYYNTLRQFQAFVSDNPTFDSLTSAHVENFLLSRPDVTNKTRLNYYISLSALWTWAVREGLTETHVVRDLVAPKAEQREILPYSRDEVKLMFAAIERTAPYQRAGMVISDHANPQPERLRAILMLLLDTGLRASECCEIRIPQIDLKRRQVHVLGKGSKERTVPFSARTAQSIWRYIPLRPERIPADPLFPTSRGSFLERGQLYHIIARLGERAGVQDVDVHRFRHTFAIEYLRNKGNPFVLPHLLGHSTMEMTRKYLRIVQMDMDDEVKNGIACDDLGSVVRL